VPVHKEESRSTGVGQVDDIFSLNQGKREEKGGFSTTRDTLGESKKEEDSAYSAQPGLLGLGQLVRVTPSRTATNDEANEEGDYSFTATEEGLGWISGASTISSKRSSPSLGVSELEKPIGKEIVNHQQTKSEGAPRLSGRESELAEESNSEKTCTDTVKELTRSCANAHSQCRAR